MQTQITASTVAIGIGVGLGLGSCAWLRSQNFSPTATPVSPTGVNRTVASPTPPSPPASTPRSASRPPLTVRILQNAEYYILAKGPIRLTNGRYEDKTTGRSFVLGDVVDYGDLNQDGIQDAVAVVQVTVPDSDKFSYLVASVNEAGTAKNVSAEFLGRELEVTQLTIKPGKKVEVVIQQGNATITRMYTLKQIKLPEQERSGNQTPLASPAPDKSPQN